MILGVFIVLAASLPLKNIRGKFSSKHLCSSASDFQNVSKLTAMSEGNVPLEKTGRKKREEIKIQAEVQGVRAKVMKKGKKTEGRKGREEATLIGRLLIPQLEVEYYSIPLGVVSNVSCIPG